MNEKITAEVIEKKALELISEKGNPIIEDLNGYYICKNQNRYSKEKYTYYLAIIAYYSNTDISSCIDCEFCSSCTNCQNCKNCSDCHNNCINCENCRNCRASWSCENCGNCVDCQNCKNCEDCERCEKCKDCNKCESCQNKENKSKFVCNKEKEEPVKENLPTISEILENR